MKQNYTKNSIVISVLFLTLLYPLLAHRPASATTAAQFPSTFTYDFHTNGTLEESSTADTSSSPYWWLNSGGLFVLKDGQGMTNQGSLSDNQKWRLRYAASNPQGTDNGYHPQNVFSMLTRHAWDNSQQEIYFTIAHDNLSNSQNIHPYNNVALLSRYQNDATYYFGSVRADGHTVIKKKQNGIYTTLADATLLAGSFSSTHPDLIPKNIPIGLRILTTTNADQTVTINLYTDIGHTGTWKLATQARDTHTPITSIGTNGIRSDFMDVAYDDYRLITTDAATASPSTTTTPLSTPSPTVSATPTPTASDTPVPTITPTPSPSPSPSVVVPGYGLSQDATIQETGTQSDSTSSDWWLNSGGYFTINNGIGATIQGALSSLDPWYKAYASANPTDTDNGAHPQNIFRLVTRTLWQNVQQEGYFTITKDNFSSSPNRDGHNGLLFFNHYVDSQNLYYTGIRVDGYAVIKKKQNGVYTTLAYNKIFPGTYDRSSNTNLLPHNTSIGLRSIVTDNADGSVTIKLYMDVGHTGTWTLIAQTTDAGANGSPITAKAAAGIRTDFMDVQLREYRLINI